MATAVLERIEQRMRQRWLDLQLAEQRGVPATELQQCYAAYLEALHAYMATCSAVADNDQPSRVAA